MSLIFPNSEAQIVSGQPRLHAFVIGVGDYPHLIGGSGSMAANPLGLSQVSTPPETAAEITRWLLQDYTDAGCPLGSVEVLISPGRQLELPGKVQKNADVADFSNIEKAFSRWLARCSTDSRNKAFFYFCGHGLNKGPQFMLPQDFGDPQWPDPWRNNIDFDRMRVGLRSCRAQTQLFFVDACRETPFGILDQINVTGQSLTNASFTDSVECSATYYATTEGKQAFGPEKDVSYFGQALVKCFNGAGATNSNGQWEVDTFSLSKTLGEVMQHLGRTHNVILSCNPNVSGRGVVNKPKGAYVIATIGCLKDPRADGVAEIVMQRGSDQRRSAVGQQRPMVEEVPPGDWNIRVLFPGGEFPGPVDSVFTLMPAVFDGVLAP